MKSHFCNSVDAHIGQYAGIKLSVYFQVHSHHRSYYPPKEDSEVLCGVVVPDVVVCVGHKEADHFNNTTKI